MEPATIATISAALSPFMVAVFTWITRRGLDRRTAEAQERAGELAEYENRLTQQREDFKALVDPLQDTLAALRERVDQLETQVRTANRLNSRLVSDMERVLKHLADNYQDKGPELSHETAELLERW